MNLNNRQTATPDVFGNAISDCFKGAKDAKINIYSSDFDDDSVPVSYLFRKYKDFPAIEKTAMKSCRGKILDIGAGAGCHSLYLKQQKHDVLSIDISPLAVEVMQQQGLKNAQCTDIFELQNVQFDTILLLMNGTGIAGTIEGLALLLNKCKELLKPSGQILIDSSDLRYLFEDEDGSFLIDLNADYYGELTYTVEYNKQQSTPFKWLYTDFETLSLMASNSGFSCDKICEGSHYDYLACLQKTR